MLIFFFGMFFLMSVQPILMVVNLVLVVLLYSLMIYKIMGGYWYGYVLILVMLSGVLVVFMYMVSLVPNESFEIYNLVFMMFFIMFLFKFNGVMLMENLSYISLNLWMMYVGVFNLFLVVFLLLLMVMVVWLSYLSDGAVRAG